MAPRDQARDVARLILRPIWHRVWARIENRLRPIEDRLQAIEPRIARVEPLDAAWNQHVPAFLNAVATVGAFGHELAALRRQVAALEAAAPRRDRAIAAPPPSLRPSARLALGEATPRLNLGCGDLPLAGYLNVDPRDLPGVDIVAAVDDLPVAPGSVAEIFSVHLLGQFRQEALLRLLPYWRSLLRPAGLFRAIVPDGSAMVAGLADGSYPFEEFRLALFGAPDGTGDVLRNLFTPDSLRHLLAEAGFTEIEIPVRGRRNDRWLEFEIVGRNPAGAAPNE